MRADASSTPRAPLAERMRPNTLEEFFGQDHLLGPNLALSDALSLGELPSLILWGPPGVGKTTLAKILATTIGAEFIPLSAVLSSVKDVRASVEQARDTRRMFNRHTVLFIDEIHRFNKAQQDALLPHVERGEVTLIGATTENPGFEINQALRSRAQVLRLEALDEAAMGRILQRALEDATRGLGKWPISLAEDALSALAEHAGGDARAGLGALEVSARRAWVRTRQEQGEAQAPKGPITITREDVIAATGASQLAYDRSGDQHYQLVSAFIKSMRGSDPDATLYYMFRMLEGGEDPMFVLRRLVIFASEDIGLADPSALLVAVNAMTAYHHMGMPEGSLPLTQAALHMALAPKSNSVIASRDAAQAAARAHGTLSPPNHLINAANSFMKQQGYGANYRYPHDAPDGVLEDERYLPEAIAGMTLYEPRERGAEGEMSARWRERKGRAKG